jgi:hypothetical protein
MPAEFLTEPEMGEMPAIDHHPRARTRRDTVDTTSMKRSGVSQPEDRHVTRPVSRDLPFLLDGDFLDVQNDGDQTIAFRWARKTYTVGPGETGFVIFEALVNALGDPRSMDNASTRYNDGAGNSGIIMDRYAEISRLFAMYGVKDEDMTELVRRAPKVTVHTMKGQKVSFPAARPDMLEYPTPHVDTRHVNTDVTRMIDAVNAENTDLRDRMERMEEQMERMAEARVGVPE